MSFMSLRNQFDEIYSSLINGQRKQAVRQMSELIADDLCEMLDYFSDELGRPETAIDAAKSFIRYSAK